LAAEDERAAAAVAGAMRGANAPSAATDNQKDDHAENPNLAPPPVARAVLERHARTRWEKVLQVILTPPRRCDGQLLHGLMARWSAMVR